MGVSIALSMALKYGSKNFFSVSTDKAANPGNVMGCTKRVMEYVLFDENKDIRVNSARFANVAFSNGSLLNGFEYPRCI